MTSIECIPVRRKAVDDRKNKERSLSSFQHYLIGKLVCYWEYNTYHNVPGYVNLWLTLTRGKTSIHQSKGFYVERLKKLDFSGHHPTFPLNLSYKQYALRVDVEPIATMMIMIKFELFFVYFFGGLECCWPLFCLCLPFCIFKRCLELP